MDRVRTGPPARLHSPRVQSACARPDSAVPQSFTPRARPALSRAAGAALATAHVRFHSPHARPPQVLGAHARLHSLRARPLHSHVRADPQAPLHSPRRAAGALAVALRCRCPSLPARPTDARPPLRPRPRRRARPASLPRACVVALRCRSPSLPARTSRRAVRSLRDDLADLHSPRARPALSRPMRYLMS